MYLHSFRILIFCVVYMSMTRAADPASELVIELRDDNYEQIQKGQWLIAFFDKETKESQQLEDDWKVYALQCKEQNIQAGRVFAPPNPALYVRFLVTVFPKVFYIKNGVAHEVKSPSRPALMDLIKGKKWAELKPVNFLNNPFSVQMSLLSHMFVYAVSLYNYEDAVVKQFVPFKSATDIAFGLTFIIVGTFLGLLLTCAFGLIQVFFMDSKDPDEDDDDRGKGDTSGAEKDTSGRGVEKEDVSEEESSSQSSEESSVRKRK